MINGKIIAGIIISVLIILGVYFFVSVGNVQQSGNSIKVTGTGSSVIEDTRTIEITSNGFFPGIVTISVGDNVTFINKDTEEHWLILEILDISQELPQGDTYSFVFNEAGTFEYYDNLNKDFTGTIFVE